MKNKILVVDDDALLRRSLKYRLEQEGYEVLTCGTGAEALSGARQNPPDVVLLDIGLPDQLGLDVARTLKQETGTRIIFLSGRRQETDIVVGLELGAEDYIPKPFGMRELLARVRVVLRRSETATAPPRRETWTVGDIFLDARAHVVRVRGEAVELPPKEFELLRLLLANANAVLTSDYLINAVWGEEFAGTLQVLYVHIGWLRERIEPDPRHPRSIITVRGVGYKFVAGETEP